MNVSIEMGDSDIRSYGSIHRTGCRDLRDPERLGEVETRADAEMAAEDLTGWGYEPGEYHFAPCVTLK